MFDVMVVTGTDSPRSVVERSFLAFNDRDHDALDAIYASKFISHATGQRGVEAIKASRRRLLTACPQARALVEAIVVEGNIVATRSRITGVGELYEGKDLILMEMFRTENGRIVELWGNASPYNQSGAPEAGAR